MECNRIITEMAILRFKNFKNQLDVPFVAYADFECVLERMDLKTSDNINLIQKHIPYACSYYIKCSFDTSLDIYRIYYGEDCAALNRADSIILMRQYFEQKTMMKARTLYYTGRLVLDMYNYLYRLTKKVFFR